ncbi:hypothetical protein [Streptomyces iconiensis]|uniref:Alpha amylase inhibitor n=1 Tax=Streptomyces iconiensis TaxID=1384038 RepID=A0ABT7A0H9_9ACTN|nr:hypothetical protein [Streptomyces iconiensis]MDJ1134835.1 hypothetical protein [Streptomyces iconiensis]
MTLAAVAMTAGLSVAPAQAASPASAKADAAAAPSCITAWVKKGTLTQTGYGRNDCSSQKRYKIVWAFGADSACVTVKKGQTLKHKIPIAPRRFDGVKSC